MPKTDEDEHRSADDSEPFSALAFKIMTDPYVGTLWRSSVSIPARSKPANPSCNSTKGQRERLGRILLMHANHREDITQVYSGDIAAAVGLKNTTTGDTLCDEKYPIVLESMEFPEPVIRVAIEPKTKAGQEKMDIALGKLAEEDPTFKAYTDEETGQTIIAGMGELHLEIIVDRLLREFRVEANVGRPQVSYKETITQGRYGGHALRAPDRRQRPVWHTSSSWWNPTSPARVTSSSTQITGGAIPKEFIPCCGSGHPGRDAGRRACGLRRRGREGHAATTARITRSTRPRWRLRSAGSMAFKEAMPQGGPGAASSRL